MLAPHILGSSPVTSRMMSATAAHAVRRAGSVTLPRKASTLAPVSFVFASAMLPPRCAECRQARDRVRQVGVRRLREPRGVVRAGEYADVPANAGIVPGQEVELGVA